MKPLKILVGSPVCQKPEILEAFLYSLKNLSRDGMTMDYIFADDNTDKKSRQLLNSFERAQSSVTILPGKDHSSYVCDAQSHHWDDSLMLRVANYKNTMVQYTIDNDYDALFLADSDLVLHPDLIVHLIRQQKEVVSEIFWSKWRPHQAAEPNVWLYDEYDLVPKELGEKLSALEMKKRKTLFLETLKQPGLYEVGGLGACTLLARSALQKGVSFEPIRNLIIHGEDRFFCIRAAVLGISLFVDTRCPAYHIYRESDLAEVADYINSCKSIRLRNRITLSMIVRNEVGRYLSRVLKSLNGHIDEAVIIDDASTDRTAEICKQLLTDIPLHLIKNKRSMFSDEISLRKKQWDETVKTNPDWILNLDADELLESGFWENAQAILDNPETERCCFRLFDMWNDTQYREDDYWNAHKTSRTFLLRYRSDFSYQWDESPQHCERFPSNCDSFPKAKQDYRIQHFGWARKVDRAKKYKRYLLIDPGAMCGIGKQYATIFDTAPTLINWCQHEK